jgi:hypothetical protein
MPDLPGESGNVTHAANLYESLIVDCTTAQGPDHPDTLNDREQLRRWRKNEIPDTEED